MTYWAKEFIGEVCPVQAVLENLHVVAVAVPEEKNQDISDGIISLMRNASVELIEGDDYQ